MTYSEIKIIVEEHFNVNLINKSRKRHLVEARYIYFKLCMDYADKKTLASIGKSLNKDHATVLHGIRSVTNWMLYDMSLLENYEKLHKLLMSISKTKNKKESLYISLAKKIDQMDITIKNLQQKVKEYENIN